MFSGLGDPGLQEKVVKRNERERQRVKTHKVQYQKLETMKGVLDQIKANKSSSKCRKKPSKNDLLAGALKYIRILKQQLISLTAETSRESSEYSTSTAISAVAGRSAPSLSSSTESSQSSSTTPTELMPVYGASKVIPTYLEQDTNNYMPSPWLPANNYSESEYYTENYSILPSISNATEGVYGNSSSFYCMCCEDHWWQNGYHQYDYPGYYYDT